MRERRWLRAASRARQVYFPVQVQGAMQQIWIAVGVMLAAVLFLEWLFQFRMQTMLAIGIMIVIEAPLLYAMHQKREEYKERFSAITGYMEQMLYSFRAHKKVLTALDETIEVTPKEPLRSQLMKLRRELFYGEQAQATEVLKKLEDAYPGRRLPRMHEFFFKVESLGGECEMYIDLLLEDLRLWVEREKLQEKAMKSRLINVLLSVLISILICLFVEKIIPGDVEISRHVLYQLSGVGMFGMDLLCLLVAARMMMQDPLSKESMDKEQVVRLYERVTGYSYKKEWKKQRKLLVIVAGCLGAAIYYSEISLLVIAMGMLLILIIKPFITRRIGSRKLIQLIRSEYSIWLMEVGMLLQETTVQEAIRRSLERAPVVLKPYIVKMLQELSDNPISNHPYQNFMKEYNLSQIQSSMKMLCAISKGGASDVKEQVRALIHQNTLAQDADEKEKNENRQGGMYALFLMPQIAVGVKLIPDMLLFLLLFLRTTQF
ncbi:hypothetical protein [Eubacterium oxidoreducens]|uniref:Flp pilus assembly protein TadB n=1 Tax=Eubacterium oxidoreducens TaxID=1732 RepID=A0A1G6BD07_EUBOX|nr:hypothetical protein [Eubacterium oxidoreducens]SDB18517.1 hypothetical protein SAMN02910417_01393 [Eubacterium oxidoreducens]